MEYSAILSTFIKLPFVIKIFVLSIFEWPFKTYRQISNCSIYSPIQLIEEISLSSKIIIKLTLSCVDHILQTSGGLGTEICMQGWKGPLISSPCRVTYAAGRVEILTVSNVKY